MQTEKRDIDLSAREKILICAEKLFIEKGYSNTSIRDVCKAAGVNIALINYYFTSKERLYKELIKGKISPIISRLKSLSEDKELSSKDRFFSLFNIYEEFYEQNSNLPQLLAREIVTNTDISRWFHRNIVAKELQYIKKIFIEAQRDGVITNKYDPVFIMSFCLGALMFILAGSSMVDRSIGEEFTIKGSTREKIEIIKELVLNGIIKR